MKRIEETVSFLPTRLFKLIIEINDDFLQNVSEIRLRKDCPIAVRCKNKTYYVDENSNLSYKFCDGFPRILQEEMEEAFVRLCEYSVYSHLDDIRNGFITLKNGSRVAFCATAVKDDGKIVSIKNISSLNIRFACQHIGCSDELYQQIKSAGFGNVLFAGEPASGKTTLLRDFARNLSLESFNVSVLDERSELFGENCFFDRGYGLDVFASYPKSEAVNIALRTMSPDYIVTDEIVDINECKAICRALNCGVYFALSIHCRSLSELLNNEIIKSIDDVRKFDYIVLLKGKAETGKIEKIITPDMR